mmetsp:Transcript_116856/g.363156  ORF Transcript_116856/g.363156 Transcript_116856/m.363156 type:complete len:345 (+) Transcript_116856:479-1513(+)
MSSGSPCATRSTSVPTSTSGSSALAPSRSASYTPRATRPLATRCTVSSARRSAGTRRSPKASRTGPRTAGTDARWTLGAGTTASGSRTGAGSRRAATPPGQTGSTRSGSTGGWRRLGCPSRPWTAVPTAPAAAPAPPTMTPPTGASSPRRPRSRIARRIAPAWPPARASSTRPPAAAARCGCARAASARPRRPPGTSACAPCSSRPWMEARAEPAAAPAKTTTIQPTGPSFPTRPRWPPARPTARARWLARASSTRPLAGGARCGRGRLASARPSRPLATRASGTSRAADDGRALLGPQPWCWRARSARPGQALLWNSGMGAASRRPAIPWRFLHSSPCRRRGS